MCVPCPGNSYTVGNNSYECINPPADATSSVTSVRKVVRSFLRLVQTFPPTVSERSALAAAVQVDMAVALQVPESRIHVVDVLRGSVVIALHLLPSDDAWAPSPTPSPVSDPTPSELAEELQRAVTNTTSVLYTQGTLRDVLDPTFGAPQAEMVEELCADGLWHSLGACPSEPTQSSTNSVTAYVAVVVAIATVVLLGTVWQRWKRKGLRDHRVHPSVVPPSSSLQYAADGGGTFTPRVLGPVGELGSSSATGLEMQDLRTIPDNPHEDEDSLSSYTDAVLSVRSGSGSDSMPSTRPSLSEAGSGRTSLDISSIHDQLDDFVVQLAGPTS